MKYGYILIFSLISLAVTAQTITSATIPSIGTDLVQYGITGFDTNVVKKSGTNQVWDFTSVAPNGFQLSYHYRAPSAGAYSELFPDANILVQTAGRSDVYYLTNDTGLRLIGGPLQAPVFPGGVLPVRFTPPMAEFNFPLSYGSSSNETASFYFNIPPEIIPDSIKESFPFELDSMRIRSNINRIYHCTGSGIIKLPAREYEAVQVDYRAKTSQHVEIKVPFLGWIDVSDAFEIETVNQFIPETESVIFLSPDHTGAVAIFNRTEETKIFETALISSQGINLHTRKIEQNRFDVYPNPSGGLLYLKNRPGDSVPYIIFNMEGKVMISSRIEGAAPVSIVDLSPGVYNLALFNGVNLIGIRQFTRI